MSLQEVFVLEREEAEQYADRLMLEFESRKKHYASCESKVKDLMYELLDGVDRPVHTVSSRVKSDIRLREKLIKKAPKYTSILEVTDIVGVRIITYFHDDVDVVAKIIRQQFAIDIANSVDKRLELGDDRFGYLSLQLIASFSSGRIRLPEYMRFDGIKFEVQIRSVLQHAWGEIEHDLGYKPDVLPLSRELKRDLASLAALLELADREFARIRDSQAERQKPREAISTQRISALPDVILLEESTLRRFVADDPMVMTIDKLIGSSTHTTIVYDDTVFAPLTQLLSYLGIETIEVLLTQLTVQQNSCIELSERWPTPLDGRLAGSDLPNCVSLFYLCFAILGSSGDREAIISFLEDNDFLLSTPTAQEIEQFSGYFDFQHASAEMTADSLLSAYTGIIKGT